MTVILFDSSHMLVRTTVVHGDKTYDYEWQADRTLARELLAYLRDKLQEHGDSFESVTGIGVMAGPGSYTGLRIGLSVLNTLADAQSIPIVGATGENWRAECLAQLSAGHNDTIVMPFYGADAHVTMPRK